MQRRDKIARLYLNGVNPLIDFALSPDGRLTFRNAAVDQAGAASPAAGYRATWSRYENGTGVVTTLAGPTVGTGAGILPEAPLPAVEGAFVKVAIAAAGDAPQSWRDPVDVYFRRIGSGWRLIGIERLAVAQR
jgi:hypothetical protein